MNKGRLLYLSAHSILEADEVSLFNELGYDVFSPGAYICPENPGDPDMRPGIPGMKFNQDLWDQWHKLAGTIPGVDPKYKLSKEFVDNFDIIVSMHIPEFITNNWENIKHKRVIWRTIGQSISNTEAKMAPFRQRGMQIVRYSPKETLIPGYIGEDALIRFYKDPEEFKGWTGEKKWIISFAQSMKQRDAACNFRLFDLISRPFPRHLFGPGNDEVGDWTSGKVPFDQLKKEMREARCYAAMGTHPASYTLNFMEAWMTGCPVVAPGPVKGNAPYFPNHFLYEVDELITHGVNGFCSDNPAELQDCIHQLLTNDTLAKQISEAGRAEAVRHFSKDLIKESWRSFLV